MTAPLQVTSVALIPAPDSDTHRGLLGYVTCVINDTLMLDGIVLRRTVDDQLTLSYPTRRDRSGRQHPVIRPLNEEARLHLEREIITALRLELKEPSK